VTAIPAAVNGDEQQLTVYSATVSCWVPKLSVEIQPGSDCNGLATGRRPGNPIERRLFELLTGRTRHTEETFTYTMAGALKSFASESDQMAEIDPARSVDVSDKRHSLTYQQTLNTVIRR